MRKRIIAILLVAVVLGQWPAVSRGQDSTLPACPVERRHPKVGVAGIKENTPELVEVAAPLCVSWVAVDFSVRSPADAIPERLGQLAETIKEAKRRGYKVLLKFVVRDAWQYPGETDKLLLRILEQVGEDLWAVELGNEPDYHFPGGTKHFWTGTPEQFVGFYQRLRVLIKGKNPEIVTILGAVSNRTGAMGYFEGLVEVARERGVTLEAVGVHEYNIPLNLGNRIDVAQKTLRNHGFGRTEIWVTEWGVEGGGDGQAEILVNGLKLALRKDVVAVFIFELVDYNGWGLFSPEPGGLAPKPAVEAVNALNNLLAWALRQIRIRFLR